MNDKIIMVRGRTSDRVGDALSRMLEGTKPRQAEHTATAGGLDAEPAPHPSTQSPASPSSQTRGSTAGGDDTHPSPPALSLEWDREEIRVDYALEQISEFEAIRALIQTGMNVCEAMDFLNSWS